MKESEILGVGFSLVSYREVMAMIADWREKGEKHYVTMTPPYSVLLCHWDAALQRATTRAALTLPDGVGIILAAKVLRYAHQGRVTGPTLMLRLCDWGREYGMRHFFYGGAPCVADTLADRLRNSFPELKVAGTYCPPFREQSPVEDARIVQLINEAKADIVWVGLGSPKQEKWMDTHAGSINAAAMIGVGAAFDFHSGRVKWAPAWVRKMGMEWGYRLAMEPRRMWRRNINSFVFLAKVLCQRVRASNGRNGAVVQSE